MINPDSNNSIVRTNIFSKSVGGKKKNKTLKKRKGGNLISRFFGEEACVAEKNNLDIKRKLYEKNAKKNMIQLRDEYNKLSRKLQIETDLRCKQYTKSQKELAKIQEVQEKQPFFKRTLKYIGGIKVLKKELEYYDKMFKKHLHNQVKRLYKYGGEPDYCISIIKEYQQKAKELKDHFDTLLVEYARKNYNEPLEEARQLYNQCALKHNEGETKTPVLAKPNVPLPKQSEEIEKDTRKLLSALLSGPEYENGKLKKPEIIVSTPQGESKEDIAKEYLQEELKKQQQMKEKFGFLKGLFPSDKPKDEDNKIQFDGQEYTEESAKKLRQEKPADADALIEKIKKYIDENKNMDQKIRKKLNKLKDQWLKK